LVATYDKAQWQAAEAAFFVVAWCVKFVKLHNSISIWLGKGLLPGDFDR
jgi:hypothetical protein